MGSFSLLSVLGNGSSRIACHNRFPLAAYQSGSILVIWDYSRVGPDSRKFVVLQPNQRCSCIFFSKDAQSVLGFWVSQGGQPTLTAWSTADGARVAEHLLSDVASSSSRAWADFCPETQHLVFAHGASVLSASVAMWDSRTLKPLHLAHGHVGSAGTDGIIAVKLLDDGRHFAVAEVLSVHFWSYAGSPGVIPRQVLRVDLGKPVLAFALQGRLAYLLPEKGKLQVMNFDGQREQVQSPTPVLGTAGFTALDVSASAVCLGCEDGSLLVCRSRSATSAAELWAPVPRPAELGASGGHLGVASVCLGMNEDYAIVCFKDATHGVVHLESGRYVALRAGHAGPVRSIAMAPRLHLPECISNRLLEADRVLASRALAFLTISDGPSGSGFIAWPKQGAPSRGSLDNVVGPRASVQGVRDDLLLDSFMPKGPAAPGLTRPSLTAVAFHPAACLASDGSSSGAYSLLAGASDGSLQLLEAEDTSRAVSPGLGAEALDWRATRVRPLSREAAGSSLASLLGQGGFSDPDVSCSFLAFSRSGQFALASFTSGAAEMLQFPILDRVLLLQSAQQPVSRNPSSTGAEVHKSFFVWQPTQAQRAYDRNLYLVCHRASPREVILYEIYPMGDTFAKGSKAVFELPAICQAAGGLITDFCAHPSQLYLVAAAVLPAAATRSIALVFDLWNGQLLKSCALFDSLLVAPLLPLRPSLCVDSSGAYLFCASTPTTVGPLDQQLLGYGAPTWDANSEARASETASVVCIVDFCTGQQLYQSSIEVSCLVLGTPWHDPTQLLVGARDGTVSVWRPPEMVAARIRSLLQDSTREAASACSPGPLPDIEEAVAWHWASNLSGQLDWASWGDCQNRCAPPESWTPSLNQAKSLSKGVGGDLPFLPMPKIAEQFRAPAAEEENDVVVQARKNWPPPPYNGEWQQMQTQPSLAPVARLSGGQPPAAPTLGASALRPRLSVCQPEIDPESGLEVAELPGGFEQPDLALNTFSAAASKVVASSSRVCELPLWRRPPEPAEMLVSAPELREEFGTSEEHFEDPLPAYGSAEFGKPLPRWLEKGRLLDQTTSKAAQDSVMKSVFSELDHFEKAHPDSQELDSPRSDVGTSGNEAKHDEG